MEVESWEKFTDHKDVTATVIYQKEIPEMTHEEAHLLEVGLRYGKLDFNKAPWTEIQAELVELFKVSPTAALVGFHEKVLGILERLVPEKKNQSKNSHPRMYCQRSPLY